MKVLWISHFVPYPPKGGMLSRSYNLLREVAKYHDVYLLAFVQKKPLITMFTSLESGLSEAKDHLSGICDGVEFIGLPCEDGAFGKYIVAAKSLFSTSSYSVNWLASDEMESAINQTVADRDINVIHFDTIGLAPYLKNTGDIPKVLNHHNIESHMMLRRVKSESNWLKKKYYYLEGIKLGKYERKVCPLFDKNITCSSLDSSRLIDICGKLDVEEIPNGVDVGYFKPDSDGVVPNSIVFAGGLNWYPNMAAMDYFASYVWPLLKEKYSSVIMDVIGQDPPEWLVRFSEKDRSFRVHGFVDDVRPFIRRAAVYVCPINDGGGTKLKVLDALAMGKALVAHPVSCEGIDVVDGESVLYAIEAEEYVDHIVKIFKDEKLRIKMGEAGRELVCDKYSYNSLGKKLSDVYSQCEV